jgi:hypothetical protein
MSQLEILVAETKTSTIFNTSHARDMLRKRYPSPEWALMEEVAPATGGGTRYADAVAVNLWRSRGHAIHGFEIKVSRSDWLRELKQPEKAEEIYLYCDHWWILAPSGIVKNGELPPNWGLLELRETGIVQSIVAPKLEPTPISREFFASIMRRGHEQITSIAERMQRASVDQARAEIDMLVAQQVDSSTKHHREREKQITEFSEKTGISFERYNGPCIDTIKLAQRLESLSGWHGNGALRQLGKLADQLERAADTVRKAVEATGIPDGIQP